MDRIATEHIKASQLSEPFLAFFGRRGHDL